MGKNLLVDGDLTAIVNFAMVREDLGNVRIQAYDYVGAPKACSQFQTVVYVNDPTRRVALKFYLRSIRRFREPQTAVALKRLLLRKAKAVQDFMPSVKPCARCKYPFDHDLLGKHGCPNCHGGA